MDALTCLAVMWLIVLVASYLTKKTGFNSVLWLLVAGSLLVNFGILPHEMPEFIVEFSELGIILIMFALGFEESPSHFIGSIKRSWGIALFGAMVPFLVAYYLALYYWGNNNIALMCGLTMTATAVSLTMMSLKSEGLGKSKAALGIMTSAVLDDIGSLFMVAVLVPMVIGGENITGWGFSFILLKSTAFFVVVTILGMFVLPSRVEKYFSFWKRFGFREFLMIAEGGHKTLVVLLFALVVSLLSHFVNYFVNHWSIL